jgi:hypothetical protein
MRSTPTGRVCTFVSTLRSGITTKAARRVGLRGLARPSGGAPGTTNVTDHHAPRRSAGAAPPASSLVVPERPFAALCYTHTGDGVLYYSGGSTPSGSAQRPFDPLQQLGVNPHLKHRRGHRVSAHPIENNPCVYPQHGLAASGLRAKSGQWQLRGDGREAQPACDCDCASGGRHGRGERFSRACAAQRSLPRPRRTHPAGTRRVHPSLAEGRRASLMGAA